MPTIVTAPEPLPKRNITLQLVTPTRGGGGGVVGTSGDYEVIGGARFRYSFEVPPLLTADALKLRAFLNKLRGPARVAQIRTPPHPQIPIADTFASMQLAAAVSAGDTTAEVYLAPGSAENLITDPGFDSGITGWLGGNGGAVSHTGTALQVTDASGGANYPRGYWTFSVTAGKTYVFSADIRVTAGSTAAGVLLQQSGLGNQTSIATNSSGTLVRRTVSYTAASSGTGFALVLFDSASTTAGDTIEADNVSLHEFEEGEPGRVASLGNQFGIGTPTPHQVVRIISRTDNEITFEPPARFDYDADDTITFGNAWARWRLVGQPPAVPLRNGRSEPVFLEFEEPL